ncbi:hypothetical protein VTG60DRAFT_2945 [Thermothelomyces hinnuleus]
MLPNLQGLLSYSTSHLTILVHSQLSLHARLRVIHRPNVTIPTRQPPRNKHDPSRTGIRLLAGCHVRVHIIALLPTLVPQASNYIQTRSLAGCTASPLPFALTAHDDLTVSTTRYPLALSTTVKDRLPQRRRKPPDAVKRGRPALLLPPCAVVVIGAFIAGPRLTERATGMSGTMTTPRQPRSQKKRRVVCKSPRQRDLGGGRGQYRAWACPGAVLVVVGGVGLER